MYVHEKMTLSKKDIKQIKARGLTEKAVRAQIEILKKGFSYVALARPATLGDGVTAIPKGKLEWWREAFSKTVRAGRVTKFVPASGAATRMFSSLIAVYGSGCLSPAEIEARRDSDPDFKAAGEFFDNIWHFAFFEELKAAMAKDGLRADEISARGELRTVLDYLLYERGLNYANLPKALLTFHRYRDRSRTPMEEHLVEAIDYVWDKRKRARVHFTISPEHEQPVKSHLRYLKKIFRDEHGSDLEITLSIQHPETDTIALSESGEPLRDGAGNLAFRPGGHGALFRNLNDLKADIVFIKNIDNVCCDRAKYDAAVYKKVLGGYLVSLQQKIFSALEKIERKDVTGRVLSELFEFARDELGVRWAVGVEEKSKAEKKKILFDRLNRPLRVCGMVKNEGEPGGGPFWVRNAKGEESLQIIEASQVDPDSKSQRTIWRSSTHFNPVDMVCGVRDYRGRPFDLMKFSDSQAYFISVKSQNGKKIKVLEQPGLWNGGMAYWNTVFIEVPISTFNPVKTVNDLLRPFHRCV